MGPGATIAVTLVAILFVSVIIAALVFVYLKMKKLVRDLRWHVVKH